MEGAGGAGVTLIAGASGFIGRHLAQALAAEGPAPGALRLLSRRPLSLPGALTVHGEVGDAAQMERVLAGVDTVYYLVHSLGRVGFGERDPAQARAFAGAAAAAGVRHIVFVGGLGPEGAGVSRHIASRRATGQALRGAGLPVSELRAAVVVGRGSPVIQAIAGMVERVPVLVVPRGADSRCQPIALDDLLYYLRLAARAPELRGGTWEVGGDEVLTYREMMTAYAELRGLRRPLLRMPLSTPRLSGLWMSVFGQMSPVLGTELIRGLASDAVVRDPRLLTLAPRARLGFRAALARSL